MHLKNCVVNESLSFRIKFDVRLPMSTLLLKSELFKQFLSLTTNGYMDELFLNNSLIFNK